MPQHAAPSGHCGRRSAPEPRVSQDLSIRFGERRIQRVGVTREDGAAWTVDGADRQAPVEASDERRRLRFAEGHRSHRTAAARALHRLRAVPHHVHRIRQRQGTGDVQGSQLSDAVAHDTIRFDSPGLEECRQRNLDSEYGRLGDSRVVKLRLAVRSREVLEQVEVAMATECRGHLLQGIAEHRLGIEKLLPIPAHCWPCPLNTKARRLEVPEARCPAAMPVDGAPARYSRNRTSIVARSAATAATR